MSQMGCFKKQNNKQEQVNGSVRVADQELAVQQALLLWQAVAQIVDRGNNAEVRKKKDGSFTVYEVKKNIVTV